MKFRQTDGVAIAAAKSGFSPASGYRLEADDRMPSQKKQPRGRRREDPLVEVWDEEVAPMLIAAPALPPVPLQHNAWTRLRAVAKRGAPQID